jgi:flavin-dependent dehydrogenase
MIGGLALPSRTTVCVVGGGPAGATIAGRLARLGHDVCLIEQRGTDRDPVYESLPPGFLTLLEVLGLRDRVFEPPFRCLPPTLRHWSNERDSARGLDQDTTFLVERGQFDAMLLDAARSAGARVIQPAVALRVDRDVSGAWRVPVRSQGQTSVLLAKFLVDAAGRRSIVSGLKHRCSAPTIAITGVWKGRLEPWDECRIEAGSDHWCWGIPLTDGNRSATVFLDTKRSSRVGRAGLDALYRSALRQSALFRGCVAGDPVGPIKARDATCRFDSSPIGVDFIKVGEAAFAIDPLSSQGVQAAVTTAMHASVAVNTMLRRSENAAIAAEFYNERQQETVARHLTWASTHYSQATRWSGHDFWKRRAASAELMTETARNSTTRLYPPPAADLPIRLSRAALLTEVPAAIDDFIEVVPGLVHPSFDRPIAFLGGHRVAPLVAAMSHGGTLPAVARSLGQLVPVPIAIAILNWAWTNRLLEPASSGSLESR